MYGKDKPSVKMRGSTQVAGPPGNVVLHNPGTLNSTHPNTGLTPLSPSLPKPVFFQGPHLSNWHQDTAGCSW